MSAVLHLVQNPGLDLGGCFAPGDAVVFMGACVVSLAGWSATGVNGYALAADCELFGVNPGSLPDDVSAVDYPGLVELVTRYPLCQSW